MKNFANHADPDGSGKFFRIYAEKPEDEKNAENGVPGNFQTFYLDYDAYRIIWEMLCDLALRDKTPENGERRQKNEERMEKIINYMRKNRSRKISLEELSIQVGMSRKGLSRFCKQYLPGGFSNYLNSLRLEQAAKLLLSTRHTILYIALCCGFSSLSHFNDRFKKQFGTNPSDFRGEEISSSG